MSKLRETKNGWMFKCPGCEHAHVFDKRWVFNNDQNAPSFTPSLLISSTVWNGSVNVPVVCHLYVTDGKIIYLPDCSHRLAGQTVDLLEFET